MSRSIHHTRQHLLRCCDRGSLDDCLGRLERVARGLRRKRLTKRRARMDRARLRPGPPLPPEAVPIDVCDESAVVHYPASPEDFREMLRRLPAGVINGLSRIRLRLEAEVQEDRRRLEERDPHTGRRGFQIVPGVYTGRCLGRYLPESATIEVFAYVYPVDIKDRAIWELLLRLQMLETLVHEVAHHEDEMLRRARGRWLGENEDRSEHYAQSRAREWLEEAVVPYLEERDADDVARFRTRFAIPEMPLCRLMETWCADVFRVRDHKDT